MAGSSGQGLSNCAGGLGGQSARAQRASEVAGSAPQPSPAKPPDAGRQAGTFSQVDCSLPNIPSSLPNIPRQADCPPARPPTVVADRGGNVCGHLGGADLGVQVLNAQTRQLRELAQRGVHVVHVRLQGAQGGVDGSQRQGRGRAWKGGRWFCGGARGVQPASIVGRGQMHASSALQLTWWCFVWWMVMVVVSTNGCKAGGATGLGGERGTEWRRPLAPAAGPCLHHPQSQPAGKP